MVDVVAEIRIDLITREVELIITRVADRQRISELLPVGDCGQTEENIGVGGADEDDVPLKDLLRDGDIHRAERVWRFHIRLRRLVAPCPGGCQIGCEVSHSHNVAHRPRRALAGEPPARPQDFHLNRGVAEAYRFVGPLSERGAYDDRDVLQRLGHDAVRIIREGLRKEAVSDLANLFALSIDEMVIGRESLVDLLDDGLPAAYLPGVVPDADADPPEVDRESGDKELVGGCVRQKQLRHRSCHCSAPSSLSSSRISAANVLYWSPPRVSGLCGGVELGEQGVWE